MTAKEIYTIWAPYEAKWTNWVRPVAFIEIDRLPTNMQMLTAEMPAIDFNRYLDNTKYTQKCAIVIDLPGQLSVTAGIALAKLGFRPIPIYNGTQSQAGARATVNNECIGIALRSYANELSTIDLPKDAPPAFLLDSNRMNRYKMAISIFDNSWDVYSQDMPSASYLLDNNISNVIAITHKLTKDLQKILYKYQQSGISILSTEGYEPPRKIIIKRGKDFDKI